MTIRRIPNIDLCISFPLCANCTINLYSTHFASTKNLQPKMAANLFKHMIICNHMFKKCKTLRITEVLFRVSSCMLCM